MATNYEKAFAARPEVYDAWAQLIGAVKAGMDQRRYERLRNCARSSSWAGRSQTPEPVRPDRA